MGGSTHSLLSTSVLLPTHPPIGVLLIDLSGWEGGKEDPGEEWWVGSKTNRGRGEVINNCHIAKNLIMCYYT